MACKIKCTYLHSSKKSELVQLIIPEDCWKGLQLLVDAENRKLAGLHPQYEFVFASTEDSVDHVSGWQCVRSVCEKAGVSKYITATDMRHYVATHYASLEVPQHERDFFIQKHMGHSKFINENVYQCPPAIQEMRTAGKFLLSLDTIIGENNKFFMKNYYSKTANGLPVITSNVYNVEDSKQKLVMGFHFLIFLRQ